MQSWFTLSFLSSLDLAKIISLIIIAGFTLLTFPIGIWIGSFGIGLSWSLSCIVNTVADIFITPLNIFVMKALVDEFQINSISISGIGLLEASKIVAIFGFYLIYRGNVVG